MSAQQPPTYRIAGIIVDASDDMPIPDAELSLSQAKLHLTATSDEQGQFLFDHLASGKYAVNASAPGYLSEAYNQHNMYSTAIAVGPGLDAEHILFRLHRQAVIAGAVSDEHGEPVRHATVRLFVEDHTSGKLTVHTASSTQTDDLGCYRFAHLHAGNYYVAVSAQPWFAQHGSTSGNAESGEGPLPPDRFTRSNPQKSDAALDVVYPITFFPAATEAHAAAELVLVAGEAQEADIHLQAVPSVHLHLTNLPPQQPNVSVIGVSAAQHMFDLSDASPAVSFSQVAPGVYEIGGLPPGDVTVIVHGSNKGQSQLLRTMRLNAVDGETVDASPKIANPTVSGKVIADLNVPLAQAHVSFRGDHNIGAAIQKDGTFSFSNVEPGTYHVEVYSANEGEYVKGITATNAKVDGQQLQIEGPDDVQLVIQMTRGLARIKGVVKAADKPQPGAMVLLLPADPTNIEHLYRMDQSDSDGTFTLSRIVPGKYVLMAIQEGWDLDWQDPEVIAPYRKKAQSLEIHPNDSKQLIVDQQPLQPAIPETQR